MKKTYLFGLSAERAAIILLFLKGYKILHHRYKTRLGEIDIIAKKNHTIVIIEVKARKSVTNIEEVLTNHQISRIKAAALVFISKNPQLQDYDLRYDFVEVSRFLWPKHHLNFIS